MRATYLNEKIQIDLMKKNPVVIASIPGWEAWVPGTAGLYSARTSKLLNNTDSFTF
jgi:hypothetical protein